MEIPKESLEIKYSSGMSIRKIAQDYKVSAGKIQRLFKEYGIEQRDSPNRNPKKLKKQLGPDILTDLYVNQKLSTTAIGKIYNVSAPSVHALLNTYGIQSRSVYEANSVENYDLSFFEKMTPELAYLLGLWATDGNVHPVHNSISIALNDLEVIEWVKGICNCSNKIYTKGKSHRIAMSGAKLVAIFRSYEIVPNKSKTLKFPQLPTEMIPHFIRGVFEGDGSVGAKKVKVSRNSKYRGEVLGEYTIRGRYSIATASKDFSNGICELLSDLYGRPIEAKLRSGMYLIEISAKSDVIKFGEWIYKDKEMFAMERKRSLFRELGANV